MPTAEAEWTEVKSPNENLGIRIRPQTAAEVRARNAKSQIITSNAMVDGPLPLYPAFNNLLVRDPTTLQYANEGYSRNSLIFNIFTRRAQAVHQAKLWAYELADGEREDALADSDYQKLLNRPNPYMTARVFWQTVELYVCAGGVAFIQKVRDEYGVLQYLYPYHQSQMNYIQGANNWVDGYVYDNGAGYRREFTRDEVFEIKFPSVNFFYPFKAISPLLSLLKEVNVDNQRGELEVALLQNGGVPAFAIYPGDDVQPMTQDQIDTAIEKIITKINGRNRGKPLLMNPHFHVEKLGMSPKDMLLTDFAKIPESRACAVYGVPAGYAQTLTGLEKAGTFANRESDKKAMFEDTIVPAWHAYAEDVNGGMAGEMFHDGTKCDECEVAFDYSKVPALAESNDKILDAATKLWQANALCLNAFLTKIGEEPLPDNDEKGSMYYTELTGYLTEAAPPPAPIVFTAPVVQPAPEPNETSENTPIDEADENEAE